MVIVQEVGRWKIVGMKRLYELLEIKLSYSLFCRNVKKLESEGLIRSITGMRRRKFLTLTNRGGKLTPYSPQFEESDIELNHDLISSNVVLALNKFPNFFGGHVIHHHEFLQAEADGVIYFTKNGIQASLAIEVELTQKAKPRITRKFAQYKDFYCFSYCLFVFNKESVFESYKRRLDDMNSDISKKIILLLDKQLSVDSFNYVNKDCYFKSENKVFKELFGDEPKITVHK